VRKGLPALRMRRARAPLAEAPRHPLRPGWPAAGDPRPSSFDARVLCPRWPRWPQPEGQSRGTRAPDDFHSQKYSPCRATLKRRDLLTRASRSSHNHWAAGRGVKEPGLRPMRVTWKRKLPRHARLRIGPIWSWRDERSTESSAERLSAWHAPGTPCRRSPPCLGASQGQPGEVLAPFLSPRMMESFGDAAGLPVAAEGRRRVRGGTQWAPRVAAPADAGAILNQDVSSGRIGANQSP
jgi:hypothetical protein